MSREPERSHSLDEVAVTCFIHLRSTSRACLAFGVAATLATTACVSAARWRDVTPLPKRIELTCSSHRDVHSDAAIVAVRITCEAADAVDLRRFHVWVVAPDSAVGRPDGEPRLREPSDTSADDAPLLLFALLR
jgi:hypothetical protein